MKTLQVNALLFSACSHRCRSDRSSLVLSPGNWLYHFILLLCLWPSPALGEDWPNWRGPARNGVSSETQWRHTWTVDVPKILWKENIGVGFSATSVANGLLYTMGNTENLDTVYCLNAQTGELVWKHSYDCPLDDRFFEGGPTSTPTVDGERVYTLSRQGDLLCFDAPSGSIHWSFNIPNDAELRIPGWGFSSSPMVHEDRVVLNAGVAGMAIDKRNGTLLWKSGDGEAGYMTPHRLKIGERWHALIASGKFYQCVDLESGQVGWKHRWLTTNGCNAADPIVHGNQVFISSGYGRGAAVLSFTDSAVKTIWANKEMQNQLNSSVLVDGYLYGFDGDEGGDVQFKCLEFSSGQVQWSHPGLGAGSLMVADNHFVVLSETGELSIAPVSHAAFVPASKTKVLESKCWTVPVLCNGLIYCRNASGEIACVNVRP